VGAALSGEGGLAFAVQTEVTAPGTGELIITGKVGASMRESAAVALAWAKSRGRELAAWMGLERLVVDLERPDQDVHVHFPSCEAEKNGPSAGATIATSLALLVSGAKLRPRIAISGEINLRGELLAIGNVKVRHAPQSIIIPYHGWPVRPLADGVYVGVTASACVQEKVVAAARQGLTHIVMPSANIKAFRRLPPKIRNSIKALKADHMTEVLMHALILDGPKGEAVSVGVHLPWPGHASDDVFPSSFGSQHSDRSLRGP
jgi:ATP-dependent Lon protease